MSYRVTALRLLLLTLGVVILSAAMLAADWWFGVPENATARYVGRKECQRCHQEQCDQWHGSDHAMAMAPATPETVRGDFNDRKFTHIAIESLTELPDSEVETVVEKVEPSQWAAALKNANESLGARVLDNMETQAAASLTEAMDELTALRPCDVAAAQDEIGQVLRKLHDAGQIKVDSAVTSTFARRGDKFFVTTDGPSGKMKEYEIKYTFGYRPLQQYLIELEGGRIQCLSLAWNTKRQRWFHLYPGETIPAGDRLHWTRSLQNWNYMCAECHSTNLQKNYDLAENTYRTTFSEINVSCETCHGPGSLHVQLADSYSPFWDRRIGLGLPNLKDDDPRVEIETCAPCHARRRVIHPGFQAGDKLLDYYLPELLDGNLYYADGQILEEDYVYGSFIQSLMYEKEVRCTDCHDPHTTRVKFMDPKAPWGTLPDNRLCTGCHMGQHPAGTYDTHLHHHHPDSSKPGTRCVECHMPETTYMVADPRRDHGIRNPRPDLTISLGIPNACNGCHDDRSKGETPEWAEEQLDKWYPNRKKTKHFAYALAAGREGRPQGERLLEAVTRRKDVRPIVRASAQLLLARYPGGAVRAAAARSLEDPEAMVRCAAVQSLAQFQPRDMRECYDMLAPMLEDPIRAVRTETARVLSRMPPRVFSDKDRPAFKAALDEYNAGLKYLDDQPGAHLQMGILHENLGRTKAARQEYQAAIRIDPRFFQARANLAMLCGVQGETATAVKQFREAIRLQREALAELKQYALDPTEITWSLANTHYSLGLLLAEDDKRYAEAAEELDQATRLAPYNPRMHYNYGLILQRLQKEDEAERHFLIAHKIAPNTFEYLNGLVHFYVQQKLWTRAEAYAQAFSKQHPRDPRIRALVEHVIEQRKGQADPSGR